MIDIGKLTQDETAELFKQCLIMLPWEVVLGILGEELTMEQKDEILETNP